VAQNVDAVSPIELMSPIVALVRVEIWSDVVCPWCFIGKRRFDNAVAQLREKGVTEPIEIVFKAYQLDPTAPVGAPTPVVDAYAKKFGGRERAEQILQHVTSVAAGDDITFNMDIALRANTILCHRALHWVLENHGARAQVTFKENLLSAYFTEGLDVGDIEVVLTRAGACGFDADTLRSWLDNGGGLAEVREDIQGAIDREVTGVPAFFIDDKYFIPGAQETDVFVKVLERILSL
jgi:predicted DsbA family dithiol-disulfide isomerase